MVYEMPVQQQSTFKCSNKLKDTRRVICLTAKELTPSTQIVEDVEIWNYVAG